MEGQGVLPQRAVLRNRIEDLSILKKAGLIKEEPDNPLNKIEVDGDDQWLLFPAKLYCGQSLLDSRRESIIIDYAFTDEIPGYHEMPDKMAGRDGFAVRDEIRMIRPGLYLGRAYIDRAFVVNFVLYNEEHDKAGKAVHEDRCSAGGLLERHPAAAHHRRQGGLSDGRPADMETGHDNASRMLDSRARPAAGPAAGYAGTAQPSAGDNLPARGQALFDQFADSADGGRTARVPYPLEKLLERIRTMLEPSGRGGGLSTVLIPLGRSLQ